MWENRMFGRHAETARIWGNFHMDKMTCAAIIWRRLLGQERFDWKWVNDEARDAIVAKGPGWWAQVSILQSHSWGRWNCDTPDAFREHCRMRVLPYSIELWVHDELVFSMRFARGEHMTMQLIRGEWETEIFNLPKRKTKAAALKEARLRGEL